MKFQNQNGLMVQISNPIHPVVENNLICVTIPKEVQSALEISHSSFIIDINEIKYSWKEKKSEWMGKSGTTVRASSGILLPAFLEYIFPYVIDAGQVFILIKILQALFKMKDGRGEDGESVFAPIIKYGKWYLILTLAPAFLHLIMGIAERIQDGINADFNIGMEDLANFI